MQISGKVLLNQAETIVRDRKNERQAASNEAPASADSGRQAGTIAGSFASRILNLQSSLAELQSRYSREQARMSYVENQPESITSGLQYEGSALFSDSELNAGITGLKEEISKSMGNLTDQLRKTEVEMENHYALGFAAPENISLTADQITGVASNDLDPQRVARLTRS